MTHREASKHRLALITIIETYFKEGNPTLQQQLFYLDASPFLFPKEESLESSLYHFPDFQYSSRRGITTVFVFAGDNHGLPYLHHHYQYAFTSRVRDFHKRPSNPNIYVNGEIRWRMEKVCQIPKEKVRTHYLNGLEIAIFLDTGPEISFNCLPVLFPSPPLPKEKAILRKAKI